MITNSRLRAPLSYFPCRLSWLVAAFLAGGLTQAHAQAQSPAQSQTQTQSQAGGTPATALALRPEFATPLSAAQALFREGKLEEAMARVQEASALPAPTPQEKMVLERTRAAIAQRQGNQAVVVAALEAALATEQVAAADEPGLVEAIVLLSARERDQARVLRWSQRYQQLGGANDSVSLMRIEAQRQTGDEAGALAALKARLETSARAGTELPENQLRLTWLLQRKLEADKSQPTLERLARSYPRAEYFGELVVAASREPDLSERGLLQLYRLLRATGIIVRPELALQMAEAALRAGYPGEAQAVLEEADRAGAFKPQAPEDLAKLREQVRRARSGEESEQAAEAAARSAADGSRLADLGWLRVSALPPAAPAEQVAPGLALIEQGVARGGLRRDTETRLVLAMAQVAAGRREAARGTLQPLAQQAAAGGKLDGLAPAVRLWALYASVPGLLPAN